MSLPDDLRYWGDVLDGVPRTVTFAAADRIERLEAERDDALQDLHHYRKHLASVEGELDAHRKEVKRLHYFASVIDEHAENIKTEAAIALRPQHIKGGDDG